MSIMCREYFTYFVFTAFCLISGTKAWHWPEWGKCPIVQPQSPFTLEAFGGQFFLRAGINVEHLTPATSCAWAGFHFENMKYDFLGSGETDMDGASRNLIPLRGTATLANEAEINGLFNATFSHDKLNSTMKIWIFTDYDKYAIAYTCNNILGFLHSTSVWVASGKRDLSNEENDDFMNMMKDVLKSIKIDPKKLVPYDPNDCRLNGSS